MRVLDDLLDENKLFRDRLGMKSEAKVDFGRLKLEARLEKVCFVFDFVLK